MHKSLQNAPKNSTEIPPPKSEHCRNAAHHTPDRSPQCTTRQIISCDLEFLVPYCAEADREKAPNSAKSGNHQNDLPKMETLFHTLLENLRLGSNDRGDCEIWHFDNVPLGFAQLRNIRTKCTGEMQLQIARGSKHTKDFAQHLICLSALAFYERWNLKRIICEAHASDTFLNRILQKAGFPLMGQRSAHSSTLSQEAQVNHYLIRKDIARSWTLQTHTEELLFEQSASENGPPILAEFLRRFDHATRVLELGSRSGQHAQLITRNMPQISWQPSDASDELLISLRSIFQNFNGSGQISAPLVIDLKCSDWANDLPHRYNVIYSSNVAHIISPQAVRNIFQQSSKTLTNEGQIWFYGPFLFDNSRTAASNQAFHEAVLTWYPPDSGLKNVKDLHIFAQEFGFVQKEIIEMPANNHILIFQQELQLQKNS